MRDDDEGQIAISIRTKEDCVFIDFAKDVRWIGFCREQGIALAETIMKHALTLPPTGH